MSSNFSSIEGVIEQHFKKFVLLPFIAVLSNTLSMILNFMHCIAFFLHDSRNNEVLMDVLHTFYSFFFVTFLVLVFRPIFFIGLLFGGRGVPWWQQWGPPIVAGAVLTFDDLL